MRRILFVFLIAISAIAQDIAPKVDEYVNAYVSQNKFMGSILIAKGGKIVMEKGYGMASLELDVPNTPQTKFRLGSVTKQFTSAAILQLEERGKLSVNDLASKYFTDSPLAWKDITIRHLLSHQSGISNYTDTKNFPEMVRSEMTVMQLIGLFKDKPLDFAPGSQMKYSNSGYEVLGFIIEKVSGMPYEQYVKKNIFERADMQGSGYDHRATIIKGRAEGYAVKDGKFENSIFIDMSVPYAAGSLYSTVDDLYRWDRALNTDKILTAKSREQMYTPLKNNYAYGWIVRDGPHKSYEHGGGIPGFSTFIARYPADDACIVVLSNIESAPSGKIAGDLANILFGEKYEVPKKHTAIQVDPKVFERYTGKYQMGPMAFTVSVEDGKLFAMPNGQGKAQLFPESETEFFLTVVNAQVTFKTGADGKATEMVLHQNGADMAGKRVP